MMTASKPTFHMYIISLYHLCRYVFVIMLTEHAQARPRFSISYLPLLKLCADPLHRRDIDLTVIFKSGRILYCLSIPIPFIMPNRLTGAPYLALLMLISFISRTFPFEQGQEPVGHLSTLAELAALSDGCSSHSICYCSCIPQLGVQLITSSVGFVAPSSLHSQLYHA